MRACKESVHIMEPKPFDAKDFVTFDLSDGTIRSPRRERLSLLPVEILEALTPSPQLADLIQGWGRQHGEALAKQFHKSDRDTGIEILADHLGGTIAALGLGHLEVELWGDALILSVSTASQIPESKGGKALLSSFLTGYLHGLGPYEFTVLPLGQQSDRALFFAGNPKAVRRLMTAVEKGEPPISALESLRRGNQR